MTHPTIARAHALRAATWTEAQARAVIAVAQAEIDRRVAKLRACPAPWNAAEIRAQNGAWSDALFGARSVLNGDEGAQEELQEAYDALPYTPALESALFIVNAAERAPKLERAA